MAFRLIGCLISFLIIVSNTWAQETILSVGAKTTYVMPHTDSAGGTVEVKGGGMFGASLTYGYQDRGVEFSVERLMTDLRGDTLDGKLVMLPLMVSGFWRFYVPGRRFIPSVGIGVGIIVNQFKNSRASNIKGFDSEVIDTVGFQILAGVEYLVRPDVAVLWDARYLFSTADVRVIENINGEENETKHRMGLDMVMTGIGVRKYF